MTDEQVLAVYDEFVEFYGGEDKLPNMEHEPIRFAHYVKLFKYYRQRNENI